MKKLLILTVILTCCGSQLYAHVAKKEVNKDDEMIKLQNQVKQLIQEKSDFDAALKLYASAARQYKDQPYYKDQYAILRRVIKMKRAMEAESMQGDLSKAQLKRWTSYYNAVRGYYYDHGFYIESAKIDKTAVIKIKNDQAKLNYIETLTVLDEVNEVKELISEPNESIKGRPDFIALQSLIQQRMDEVVDIAHIEKMLIAKPQENPRAFVYLGCIYQLQKNQKKAYQSIVKALENTPPTQISMTRRLIENMKEFKDIRKTDKYLAVIKTGSKVYQSGCTGGSSCNSCSLKDKCPSNK